MEQKENKVDGRKTRTDFYRKYEPYKLTWEFKETFLKRCEAEVANNNLNEHKYNALRNLMYKVARWERMYKKDVYNFTLEELKGMLKDFNSASEMSLMSQKSNLEYYLWYAKKIENQGDSNIAPTINLSIDEVKDFINPISSEERYISKDDLYELVTSNLVNYVDQALILLIFEGIMGKANSELINLKWRDIDFERGIIKFERVVSETVNNTKVEKTIIKELQIDGQLTNILDRANNQEKYLLANGITEKEREIETSRKEDEENSNNKSNIKRTKVEIVDKYDSPYLIRPLKSKNNEETQISAGSIQRRILNSFKLYLNRPYLTLSSIYISGLADRGVRHSDKQFGGEMMRNADWQKYIKQTGEKVNLQDSYKLYVEFWNKWQIEKKELEEQMEKEQQQGE